MNGKIPTGSSTVKITPDMIKNFKTITCECGGMIFENAFVLKRISSIISPTGKEETYPLEVIVCKKCGKIPEELGLNDILPEEIISKKIKLTK